MIDSEIGLIEIHDIILDGLLCDSYFAVGEVQSIAMSVCVSVCSGAKETSCRLLNRCPDPPREGALFGVLLEQAQTCRGRYSQPHLLRATAMRPLATDNVTTCCSVNTVRSCCGFSWHCRRV